MHAMGMKDAVHAIGATGSFDGECEREVGARDCALLLAVPLTAEAFEAAYRDPSRDFCRQFDIGGGGVAPRTVWALMFERTARLVARLAEAVERRGVTVVRETRLSDWTDALRRHRVVTLVAHWRFVPIRGADIADAAALRQCAGLRATPIARAVDDALGTCDEDPERMASALEALCVPAVRRYQASDHKGAGLPRGPSRVVLEQHLPGLRPAPAIELADRMYTAAEVVKATPVDFDGLLDLSVCNSILLAEVLRQSRRPVLIASGEFRASLAFRMIRYQVLIEELYRRPAHYSQLLQQLGRRKR